MEGCVFCAIVGGRAPAHRLLEDEHTVSFLNIALATPGHALVVPRRHAEGLWDLEDEEHAQVAVAAGRVARLLRAALEPAGVNLVHATGAAAWQTVFHFHTHVVPRYRSGPLVACKDPRTAAALNAFALIPRFARAAIGTRRAGPATAGTTNL